MALGRQRDLVLLSMHRGTWRKHRCFSQICSSSSTLSSSPVITPQVGEGKPPQGAGLSGEGIAWGLREAGATGRGLSSPRVVLSPLVLPGQLAGWTVALFSAQGGPSPRNPPVPGE